MVPAKRLPQVSDGWVCCGLTDLTPDCLWAQEEQVGLSLQVTSVVTRSPPQHFPLGPCIAPGCPVHRAGASPCVFTLFSAPRLLENWREQGPSTHFTDGQTEAPEAKGCAETPWSLFLSPGFLSPGVPCLGVSVCEGRGVDTSRRCLLYRIRFLISPLCPGFLNLGRQECI